MKNLSKINNLGFFDLFIIIKFNIIKYFKAFHSFSLPKQILVICFFLLPWFMMIGRALADLVIVLICISFLVRSALLKDWFWIKTIWIRYALLFWIIGIISAFMSIYPEISFKNGIAWIRFPIFAIASIYWILDKKELKIMFLVNSLLLAVTILLVSIIELSSTLDYKGYLYWPFNNPLVGAFISRLGILSFLFAIFLYFNSKMKVNLLTILFICTYFFILLKTGSRTGTISNLLPSLLLVFFLKPRIKKLFNLVLIASIFLIIIFLLNKGIFDKFTLFIFSNELEATSLKQYLLLWKTGIKYFYANFLIGMGPTNFQNYFMNNNISVFLKEHPHNHYIQAFTETGIIGGMLYVLLIIFLFKETIFNTLKNRSQMDNFFYFIPLLILVSLFWPLSNNYDLYGQQQNSFLWYLVSISLSINALNKSEFK